MKNKTLLLLLFGLFFMASNGVSAQAKNLRAFLDTKQYFSPSIGHYTEFQYQFIGYSLNFKGLNDGLIADVAVQLDIVDSNGQNLVSDLYRLQSPFMKDSIVEDFYDIRRYAINPGKYNINIQIFDVNSDLPPLKATSALYIEDKAEEVSFSQFQMIEYAVKGSPESPFYKAGYEMIPRISNYFPKDLSYLPFYVELYNCHYFGDSLFVKQSIIDRDRDVDLPKFQMESKYAPDTVITILRNVDLTRLPTGAYKMVLKVYDLDGDIRGESFMNFDRQNDIEILDDPNSIVLDPAFEASISLDSAIYYLASLIPIAQQETQRSILLHLKEHDPEMSKKFIQSFWIATAGTQAYRQWLSYKSQVQLVQKIYGNNFMDGYETDRGRVYLQYGSPTNIVTRENSPTEYPYEIWQYNKIERFSNKRFIFYNPELTNKNYRLIHSDMIGEIKNSNWPQVLNSRNTPNGTIDDPNSNVQEHFGGSSNTLFRQY
jgi:GWxTD domain-containing protein